MKLQHTKSIGNADPDRNRRVKQTLAALARIAASSGQTYRVSLDGKLLSAKEIVGHVARKTAIGKAVLADLAIVRRGPASTAHRSRVRAIRARPRAARRARTARIAVAASSGADPPEPPAPTHSGVSASDWRRP